ncbi:MAG TPA: alpha-glucosidase [Asticcacaulis sp.]|nr:alpha-glucosidase [Asticcacaulis sp.]
MSETNGYVRRWWKEAVVYQVYPRSFYDSNGDGIGDLRGVVEKLDHIKGLGVDVIWLSPHYDSPNADNGYDIRDYRQMAAEFGSMADFDDLLGAVHAAGMKLIIDLVVNHTSDEHAWFIESRKGRDNPYRDYYIWRPGRDGQSPNNWPSIFGGSAWTRDGEDYYLHLFSDKQPDLNWDNPAVRGEVYDLMRFWLDKGVDGFRMDVIPFISKVTELSDLPEGAMARPQDVYASGPNVHDYLQEMRREALASYDVMTVGEAFGVSLAQTPTFVDERRGELDMVFQFDVVEIDRGPDGRWRPWTLPDLKAVYARQDKALDKHCWPAVFLGNHDNPRIVSRFGDDRLEWRVKSAQVLATLLLTMKGTPFLYQGDEIGMTNMRFADISQFDDIWVRKAWHEEVDSGRVMAANFLAERNRTSRDHARTPMQWSDTANGGFTEGKPWLAVNTNFPEINAETSGEIYDWYATLIALRRATPTLVYSDYRDLAPEHPHVFAYDRVMLNEGYRVLLNFSAEPQVFDCPETDVIMGNYETPEPNILRGWEARIYRLKA